ncbi:15620_t:CDS:2 [Rhizophagus irregularis]|nr:15620_t:CDS:2 [Rhizophagus irregularis]
MSATPTTPTPSISVMKEEKNSIMKNAFHVPDNHIVQWPNTALSESKVRKFDGSRAKQPDFVISVNYQSQSASVI